MRLNAQAEVRRGLMNPVLDRCLFHQLPEGKVHFNRIKLSGVITEKFLLRELGRIEVRLPRWISPPGRSGKQLRHGKVSKNSAEDGIIPCVSVCAQPSASQSFPRRGGGGFVRPLLFSAGCQ